MHYYFDSVLGLGQQESRYYADSPVSLGCRMPLGGWLSDRLRPRLGQRRASRLVAAGGMIAVRLC